MNLNNLETSIQNLSEEVSSLKGKVSVLEEQYSQTTDTLTNLKAEQIVNAKSIELLNFVQKATKELIQETFEGIVTKALQYVYQNNDYKFELEFSQHGNTPKLSFLLKTPDMQEAHDILDTRAGGSKDIITLALRLVLLEISHNKGFLFLDEPFKRLDNEETIQKAIEFVQETQKDTQRQIIMITHKKEVVESVPNPIIIQPKDASLVKIDKNIKPKKRRKDKNAKKN